MCGITGIYRFGSEEPISRDRLKKMADAIVHRGPDGEGYFVDKSVGLAHRRLSIIDLEGGHQPMFNEENNQCIVFNGEIYNYIEIREELSKKGHKFFTNSDTEVILKSYQEWGFDCQEKFNGMWAFAIWDKKEQHLFLSRDRLGQKPLNFMVHKGSFLFGSEIKSIISYTGAIEPNYELLELYLFLGYIPSPYTFYKSVQKLEAGKYLVINKSGIKEHSYWDLPDISENDLFKNEYDVLPKLEELITDAVKIRMRSDVPYGAFLSGGLDSSSIVSTMSSLSQYPVKTFTIGFHEKAFDESEKAKLVAEQFNCDHNLEIIDKSSLEKSTKQLLHSFDEPFADPAAIPSLSLSNSASKHVKMVLTGDGGDEVFAGYSAYQSELIAKKYLKLMPGVFRPKIPSLINWAGRQTSGNNAYRLNRIGRVLNSFDLPFEKRLSTKFVKVAPLRVKSLYGKHTFPIEEFIDATLKKCRFNNTFHLLNYFQLKVSLPDQMLIKIDKTSMACSLETRAPFLDYRIVELLYQVDQSLKMPSHSDKNVKYLLKAAMKSKVPNEIINRQKKGFDVPLREWFKGQEFENQLNSISSIRGLNSNLIQEIIVENSTGKIDHGSLLWRLMLLKLWLDN